MRAAESYEGVPVQNHLGHAGGHVRSSWARRVPCHRARSRWLGKQCRNTPVRHSCMQFASPPDVMQSILTAPWPFACKGNVDVVYTWSPGDVVLYGPTEEKLLLAARVAVDEKKTMHLMPCTS